MYDFFVQLATDYGGTLTRLRVWQDAIKSSLPSATKQIHQIDYTADILTIRQWLTNVLTDEPPPHTIQAFYFGLFYTVEGHITFYISGSPYYNPNDETGEWATLASESYLPKARYAPSPVLIELYDLTHGQPSEIEDLVCLGYIVIAIADACKTIDPDFWLGSAPSRGIAIGYDNGDIFYLPDITR